MGIKRRSACLVLRFMPVQQNITTSKLILIILSKKYPFFKKLELIFILYHFQKEYSRKFVINLLETINNYYFK